MTRGLERAPTQAFEAVLRRVPFTNAPRCHPSACARINVGLGWEVHTRLLLRKPLNFGLSMAYLSFQ